MKQFSNKLDGVGYAGNIGRDLDIDQACRVIDKMPLQSILDGPKLSKTFNASCTTEMVIVVNHRRD